MGAVADWRRVRRLGRYLVRDRRRLLVALLLLVPLVPLLSGGGFQPLGSCGRQASTHFSALAYHATGLFPLAATFNVRLPKPNGTRTGIFRP